jgi:iron complex outermembrane receptor protein
LGAKSVLLDGTLVLNAAAYSGKMDGLTTTDFVARGDGVAVAVSVPGGSIISQGIEFEGYWYATDSLTVDFGVSLDMSEYDEFNVGAGNLVLDGVQPPGSECTVDVCTGNQVFVMDGEDTPFTPDVTIGLGVSYDIDLGDMGIVTPNIYTYYNSGYDTARTPSFFTEQDTYTKVDLAVNWLSQSGDWTAKFWVNNATDETIATYTEFLSKARSAQDYAAPKTWGLRVGYNF